MLKLFDILVASFILVCGAGILQNTVFNKDFVMDALAWTYVAALIFGGVVATGHTLWERRKSND